MDIIFISNQLQKRFNNRQKLVKVYGAQRARKIAMHMANLRAAEALSDMQHFPGRCHPLRADRAGQFALSLDGPYRLIFEPANEPLPRHPSGDLDLTQVTSVRILEVENYHDK